MFAVTCQSCLDQYYCNLGTALIFLGRWTLFIPAEVSWKSDTGQVRLIWTKIKKSLQGPVFEISNSKCVSITLLSSPLVPLLFSYVWKTSFSSHLWGCMMQPASLTPSHTLCKAQFPFRYRKRNQIVSSRVCGTPLELSGATRWWGFVVLHHLLLAFACLLSGTSLRRWPLFGVFFLLFVTSVPLLFLPPFSLFWPLLDVYLSSKLSV